MNFNKSFKFLFIVFTACSIHACNQSAGNPKEASEILISAPKWTIEQIFVNDVNTFKDGKIVQQFGGIDFDRYMETVSFKGNGDFEGYFKGDKNPMLLKWAANDNEIAVTAADGKGGAWTISPKDVHKSSFEMKTQSTAYDFPNVTKISLKFKKE